MSSLIGTKILKKKALEVNLAMVLSSGRPTQNMKTPPQGSDHFWKMVYESSSGDGDKIGGKKHTSNLRSLITTYLTR